MLQLAEPRGRPGYIGSADEQAYQFLQERRMDGDVKIPIETLFFELIEIYFDIIKLH